MDEKTKSKKRKKRGISRLLSNVFKFMFMGSKHVELSIFEEEKMQSPMKTALNNFYHNKLSMSCLVVFICIFLFCFILASIFPIDLSYTDTTQINVAPGFSMLKYPKSFNGGFRDISGGSTFGAGIDKNGKFFIWGNPNKNLRKAIKKNNPGKYKFTQISCGQDHILGISQEGKVINIANIEFGLNTLPEGLDKETNVKQVVAGPQFSIVCTEEGKMYIWGNTNFLGVLNQYTIPPDVQGNVDKIECNSDNVIVLLKDKTIRVLGSESPSLTECPNLDNVIDIGATDVCMAAVQEDGKITVWGNNKYNLRDIPSELGKIKSITGGRFHFVTVDENGKVNSWGRNNFGQTDVPNKLAKLKIKEVVCSYFGNYAISEDDNITTWGLKGYIMGSDQYGRNLAKRIISGGKLTLTVGFVAIVIQVIIAIIIGGISGFYGGQVDNLLMRFAEIVGAIPFLPLAMTLSVLIGNKLDESQRVYLIMGILGIIGWPGLARLIRGQILSEREKDFVLAAKAVGVKEKTIIFKHIMPNVLTIIIVSATLSYASTLLTESGLSFLGFGVVEPRPTWGNILNSARSAHVLANYWWRWVLPSLILAASTISINMVGDGLRDAIDPKANDQ